MDSQLKNYVETQKKAGVSNDEIKNTLLETGWDENSIDEVMKNSTIDTENSTKIPIESAKASSPGLTPKIKSSKNFLPFAIILIIGLLIGGGVWAYMAFYPKMSPEEILLKSVKQTNELNSYEFNSILSADLTIPKDDLNAAKAFVPITSGKIDLKMSGIAQKTDEKIEGDFKFALYNEETQIFDAQEKIKDYKVYYKLNSLNIPLLGLFVDVDKLTENWIKLSSADLMDKNEKSDEDMLKYYMDALNKIEKDLDYSKLYTIKNIFDDEKINDINTYHYQIEINKNEAIAIIEKVASELIGEIDKEDNTIKEIEKTISTTKLPPIDLWIGKKDMNIHQIYGMLKVHDLGIPVINKMLDAKDTLSLKMNLKNFNNTPTIEIPKNSITIDELITKFGGKGASAAITPLGLFGAGLETSMEDEYAGDYQPSSALDTITDTDGDGLFDSQELIYKTDINNPDTDGDGFSDGKEVEGGYNPLGEGKLKK